MGLALALAAGPLRAQEPPDLGLGNGDASKGLLKKVYDSPPPWAVESPGAAGATFGLGLDSLFDHQESLDLASMRTTVTVRDSGGGGSVTEVPGDPALLNRKFDFLSELQGEGTQGSIALPNFGLPFYPTFHWQALSADLRLDFLDRPEPTESTSIEGRGLLYGVGFDLVTALCKHCGWFASAGYQVQDMPSFDADRKPRLADNDLSNDHVRIRRQVRDASFRVGYGVPGARMIPYTGVRRRSTDLDIEDELDFRGPGPDGTTEETRLRTRTKIKGDATLAVAGLDVKFGGGFFGRAETAIGDGDWVVMVRVVYLMSAKPTWPPPKPPEELKRAHELAVEIAPALATLKAKLLGRWPEDPKAREDFLDQARAEIERILAAPELAAARDYVFRDFPDNGPPAPVAALLPPARGMALAAFRPDSSANRAAKPPEIVDLLRSLAASVSLLLHRAEAEDLQIWICAATLPGHRGTFELWPASYPTAAQRKRTPARVLIYRGLYAYHAESGSDPPIDCSPPKCPRLDLMTDSGPGLLCEFDLRPSLCSLQSEKPKGCS